MHNIHRLILPRIVQSLKNFPVIYLAGPRQSGKTTLAKHISHDLHPADYITFDNIQLRSAAKHDPNGFLRSFRGSVILDEIQMAPELFRPLKIIVDENRQHPDGGKGKFLLTGSAGAMALPALCDALVGRMVIHNLSPFSVLEISSTQNQNLIDRLFTGNWHFTSFPSVSLKEMLLKASFPELFDVLSRRNSLHKNPNLPWQSWYEWCDGYINTILLRDIQTIMEIEKTEILPDLLRFIATRTGGLLNTTSLSRDVGLNNLTSKRYRLLLESLFLTLSIPAWSRNLGKRLIKSPKLYINDINLLLYLLNIHFGLPFNDLLKDNPMLFGKVLENFVAIELTKQLSFSDIHAKLYHYRSASQQEVDFILEGQNQQIIGIEVKANSQVNPHDFIHLRRLKEELGTQFLGGYVFYQGTDIVPFGEQMWAMPITAFWN